MKNSNLLHILSDLRRDEDFRQYPYLDTAEKLTIGYGRNLTDEGITRAEGEFLLRNNVAATIREVSHHIQNWSELDETRVRAIVNMGFNLGWPRLSKFRKMLAAIEARKFETAAMEALDSKWAGQVGDRATRIAALIRFGEKHDRDPNEYNP